MALTIASVLNMYAFDQFNPGNELYVSAKSGLNLRTSPDVHGHSLKVLHLGEKVTVVERLDSLGSTSINWVKGGWIEVEHEGDVGYIFDGYVSTLKAPMEEWELCHLDLDLIDPLEQWSDHHHVAEYIDTVDGYYMTRVTHNYTNGNKLSQINTADIYKVELVLNDVRVMDAYHLLQNMIEDKSALKVFQDQSIFIKGKGTDEVERIKVKLDYPVHIRKQRDGSVKIAVHGQDYICGL